MAVRVQPLAVDPSRRPEGGVLCGQVSGQVCSDARPRVAALWPSAACLYETASYESSDAAGNRRKPPSLSSLRKKEGEGTPLNPVGGELVFECKNKFKDVHGKEYSAMGNPKRLSRGARPLVNYPIPRPVGPRPKPANDNWPKPANDNWLPPVPRTYNPRDYVRVLARPLWGRGVGVVADVIARENAAKIAKAARPFPNPYAGWYNWEGPGATWEWDWCGITAPLTWAYMPSTVAYFDGPIS